MPPIDPATFGEALLQALTLGILLIGLFGLLIPVFPALLVMWLATLFYALLEAAAGHMPWYDWVLFALITGLMVLGNIIDNIIIARHMRGREIPWISIGVSYLAGLVASIFLTPIVGILASLLALFGAEWIRLRRPRLAFSSARSYMIAWSRSFITVFGIGVLMILVWILWAMVLPH